MRSRPQDGNKDKNLLDGLQCCGGHLDSDMGLESFGEEPFTLDVREP
jgi:hypothetical protein